MSELRKFTMTEEQRADLLEACKPVPYIVAGGVPPRSPQQNANAAWQRLGEELGFDWRTVEPCDPDDRHFLARPKESP